MATAYSYIMAAAYTYIMAAAYTRHENGSQKKKLKGLLTNASGVSEASGAQRHGVGSRGPLKGPWWGSRGRSPPKFFVFDTIKTLFNPFLKTYFREKNNNILRCHYAPCFAGIGNFPKAVAHQMLVIGSF
jgi:hypothetical protein